MAPAPLSAQIVAIDLGTLQRVIEDSVREAVREELARLQAPDQDTLLTASEAARLIGKTENALRVATSRGDYPCVHQGRSVRWRRSDLLEKWVEQ